MSFTSTIKSFFSKSPAPVRDEPAWTGKNLDLTGQFSKSSLLTGELAPKRGDRELLIAYRDVPAVFSVVKKVSDNASSTPFKIYKQVDEAKKVVNPFYLKSLNGSYRRKELRLRLQAEDGLEEIQDHPFHQLMARPNAEMSGRTMRWLTFAWIDVVGEAFWIKERDARGKRVVALWPVPTHWVTRRPGNLDEFYHVLIGTTSIRVAKEDMIWFRHPDLESPYSRGSSAGQAVADDVDIDEYAVQHINSFFHNRAMPDMIISVEEADDTTLANARDKWELENRGFRRAYRTAWISGQVSVERLDTSFGDLGLIDMRRYTRDTILQTFGISPEMLGILDDSNRATVSEARFLFAENVLVPRLDLVCEELERSLIPEWDERIILSFDSPIPDDNEFKLNVMNKNPSAFKQNEWRKLASLPETEDGDRYMIPTDVADVVETYDDFVGPYEPVEEVDDEQDTVDEEEEFNRIVV